MYTDFWDSDPKVRCVNVLLCEEMDPNPLPELVVFNLLFCLYNFLFFLNSYWALFMPVLLAIPKMTSKGVCVFKKTFFQI